MIQLWHSGVICLLAAGLFLAGFDWLAAATAVSAILVIGLNQPTENKEKSDYE